MCRIAASIFYFIFYVHSSTRVLLESQHLSSLYPLFVVIYGFILFRLLLHIPYELSSYTSVVSTRTSELTFCEALINVPTSHWQRAQTPRWKPCKLWQDFQSRVLQAEAPKTTWFKDLPASLSRGCPQRFVYLHIVYSYTTQHRHSLSILTYARGLPLEREGGSRSLGIDN